MSDIATAVADVRRMVCTTYRLSIHSDIVHPARTVGTRYPSPHGD
jgi:hypothetical protein